MQNTEQTGAGGARVSDNDKHDRRIADLVDRDAQDALIGWECVDGPAANTACDTAAAFDASFARSVNAAADLSRRPTIEFFGGRRV